MAAAAALSAHGLARADRDAADSATDERAGTTVELSSALGAGTFDGRAMGLFDFGFEFRTDRVTVGTGVRLRFVGDDGLRTADWDDSSEIARILRYVLVRPDRAGTTSIAIGSLTGIGLSRGSLVDGYVAGIDADHGHTGATVRVQTGSYHFDGFVDDIIAPRIAGAELARWFGRWQPSIALAADWRVPRAMQTAADDAHDTWVGTTLAARYRLHGDPALRPSAEWFADAGFTSYFGLATAAAIHVGTDATWRRGRALVTGRAEVLVGSDRYIAGFIGPLYERDRRVDAMDGAEPASHSARLAAGGLAGFGGRTAVSLAIERAGDLELAYSARNSLPDIARVRASFAQHTRLQVALWAAAELRDSRPTAGAMALEARFDLPRGLYVSLESSRTFRDDGVGFAPLWTHSIAVGATRTAHTSDE